jgi:hypothetical protein
MSISYFIQTTVLVEPTREVFINMFENALKLDAKLEASPEILADKMMEQLSTPNKYGHYIARGWCGFIVKEELAGFDLYCNKTASNMLSIAFSIESRKVYCDEDEEGYGSYIDFNWYLKKILFMVESYGIGYLEGRISNDDSLPFDKWEVWAHVSGGHSHSFLGEFNKEPSMRTEEDKALIVKRHNEIVSHLTNAGYKSSFVNIEDIVKNEKSIIFTIVKEDFEVQVTIRSYHIYLTPLNGDKPRNIRPYIELLYKLCQDDCVYRYFACNGRSQEVIDQ